MFTIKLLDRSTGKPVQNKKVGIIFSGFMRGVARDRWTDADGEVHFTEDNGNGCVYVDGQEIFNGYLEGKKFIYI